MLGWLLLFLALPGMDLATHGYTSKSTLYPQGVELATVESTRTSKLPLQQINRLTHNQVDREKTHVITKRFVSHQEAKIKIPMKPLISMR